MTRNSYELEEVGGNTYPELATVQKAMLLPLAQIMTRVIQKGIKSGHFVVEEGMIKLSLDETLGIIGETIVFAQGD